MSFAHAIREVSCERGLLIRVVAADGAATAGRMPTGHSLAPLADVPDGQRRDGEPVEELKRREFDDAIRSRPRGLSRLALADPGTSAIPSL